MPPTILSNRKKTRAGCRFAWAGCSICRGGPTDEVYGLNSLVGALIVRRGIGGTLRNPAFYLGASIEAGNAWNDIGRSLPGDWIMSGSAFIATDTLLGPIHLALGKAERRAPTIYFYLSRVLP